MSEHQANSAFANDIDVVVHSVNLKDVLDLAEIYGFGYKLLQRTYNTFNICIEFESAYQNQILAFIENVNEIKKTEIVIY